jgi:hypothetical protein
MKQANTSYESIQKGGENGIYYWSISRGNLGDSSCKTNIVLRPVHVLISCADALEVWGSAPHSPLMT